MLGSRGDTHKCFELDENNSVVMHAQLIGEIMAVHPELSLYDESIAEKLEYLIRDTRGD